MRQWVFAAPINSPFEVWDEDTQDYASVTFTPDFARRLVDNTNLAIRHWIADAAEGEMTPFLPPVLSEHKADGWRGGSVHGARVSGLGPRYGIYLDVDFLDSVSRDIVARHTNYVSIGTLSHYKDYKGREYRPIIKELSITEEPRLKNIGSIQDTTGLRLSDALTYGASKMDEQTILDMKSALDAIVVRLDAIEARQVATEEVVAEIAPEAVVAAEEEEKKKEDPAVALADAILLRAITMATRNAGAVRLGSVPAGQAPTTKQTRRELGLARGLRGVALCNFVLGV